LELKVNQISESSVTPVAGVTETDVDAGFRPTHLHAFVNPRKEVLVDIACSRGL